MNRERDKGDDGLRELLRRWDPSRDDAGLDPSEAARMRRIVVEAGLRGPAWGHRLAWAAAAAATLIVVALVGRDFVREPPPSFAPPAPTTPAPTGPGGEAPTVAEGPASTPPEAEGRVTPPATAPAAAPPPVPAGPRAVVTANLPEAEAAREPRHIQFTAPGGTRIIWTLDPDFRL